MIIEIDETKPLVKQALKRLLDESLKMSCGNKDKASKILGIGRATFYRWLKKYV